MAGDPIYEATAINIQDTTWTSTVSSAEPTTTSDYDVYITFVDRTDYYADKIKELLRKEIVLRMKKSWVKTQKEFKPVPIIRPAAQLRGVCFGGRGWA